MTFRLTEYLPYNFSILTTFRSPATYSGNLFGFYSESADPKLAVQLTDNGHVVLFYEDGTRDFDQPFKRYPTFKFNATDNRYIYKSCGRCYINWTALYNVK